MRNPVRLALVAGVTFVIGVLAFFPARVAYQWFTPSGVTLSGMAGSVWHGSAAEASMNGFYLRDLRWRWRPAGLLRGGLFYRLEASPPSGFLDATVGVTATGALLVQDLRMSLSLSGLHLALPVPAINGSASLQFDSLRIAAGIPTGADGILQVADLIVPWVNRQSLGGFRVEFMTRESGLIGTFEDTDAIVDVAGTLEVREDRRWELVLLVAANEMTPPEMRQQLPLIGPGNDREQYEFRRSGQL